MVGYLLYSYWKYVFEVVRKYAKFNLKRIKSQLILNNT